jgi:hypothetical protein
VLIPPDQFPIHPRNRAGSLRRLMEGLSKLAVLGLGGLGGGSKPCCCATPTPTPTPCPTPTNCCGTCNWTTMYPTLYITDQYQTVACVWNGISHWIGCYGLTSVTPTQQPCGCQGNPGFTGNGTYVIYTIGCSGSVLTINQTWCLCVGFLGTTTYCTHTINLTTCAVAADACGSCNCNIGVSQTYTATNCSPFPISLTMPNSGSLTPFTSPVDIMIAT